MNILLLEPYYRVNYPPIGLMKLAYYHKELREDFVWFCKGKLPEKIDNSVIEKLHKDKYHRDKYGAALDVYIAEVQSMIDCAAWDRVYVTTLFTFEWDKTIKAIEYAKDIVGIEKVRIGGILATLMPEELEKATGIKPMTGLLTDSAVLGLGDHVNIDQLTPDYSILAHSKYDYPLSDSYIIRATRGCGMKCSFCAVQTLEPECVDYLPLAEMVQEIDEKYGERQHLCLMDNNILKSRSFERIIQDIIDLGYKKGATKINPKSGKQHNVYVDFNQGLDMNFVTEKKMKLLSKLALRPIRIAFDHISDQEKYVRAVRLAEKYDICQMSNYMLYNTENFKGKGKPKTADTPEDLYRRLRINAELQEEFNDRRRAEGKLVTHMYSYPMKFVPLGHKNRQYIGINWNRKMLIALRKMTNPFAGIVHCSGFDQNFGASYEEFYMLLWQPGEYLKNRGSLDNLMWTNLRKEWKYIYKNMSPEEHEIFEEAVHDNEYSVERFLELQTTNLRKLYLHYIYSTKFLEFMTELQEHDRFRFEDARRYATQECPAIYLANRTAMLKLKNAERYFFAVTKLMTPELYSRSA